MNITKRAEYLISAIAKSNPVGEKFLRIVSARVGMDFDSFVLSAMIKKQGRVMITDSAADDWFYKA